MDAAEIKDADESTVRLIWTLRKPFLLVAFSLVFWQFAFEKRYAPDFFVQADYLYAVSTATPTLVSSLRGNWVVLDFVATALQAISGLNEETALKVLYFAVFLFKYGLLLALARRARYVAILFLWSFFSQDINQFRLNIALALLPILFLRGSPLITKAAATLAMLAAHLSSVVLLPVAAAGWIRKRWQIAAAVLVLGAAAVASFALDFSLDERFREYADASTRWIPKSLLACPFMLLVLHKRFDVPTRVVLAILAVLPLGATALGLQLVSQRMIEMSFSAMLIKVAVEGMQLDEARDLLLLAPAVAIFGYRALYGILQAG